jgi:hypothetical protein
VRISPAPAFLGDEDVEAIGFEDVAVADRRLDRLPELAGIVVPHARQIDRGGIRMRSVADDAAGGSSGEIDAHAQAFVEDDVLGRERPVVVVIEERHLAIQARERRV